MTTYKTHKRQTSMPPAGFEHKIPANDRRLTLRRRGHRDRPSINIAKSEITQIEFRNTDIIIIIIIIKLDTQ